MNDEELSWFGGQWIHSEICSEHALLIWKDQSGQYCPAVLSADGEFSVGGRGAFDDLETAIASGRLQAQEAWVEAMDGLYV